MWISNGCVLYLWIVMDCKLYSPVHNFLMLKAKHMVTTASKNIIIIVSWRLYPAVCILLWEIISIESSMQKILVPSLGKVVFAWSPSFVTALQVLSDRRSLLNRRYVLGRVFQASMKLLWSAKHGQGGKAWKKYLPSSRVLLSLFTLCLPKKN